MEYLLSAKELVRDLFLALNSISWQFLLLLVALLFRQAIVRVIDATIVLSQRVRKVGDIEIDRLEKQQPADPPPVSEVALVDVLADDPSLEPWARQAEVLVENSGLNEKGKEKEREKRLLRAWAHANRAREFDAVLRAIFLTQIDVLHKLSDGPADGKSLKRFHNVHMDRAVERGVSQEHIFDFQQWLKFLFEKNLIRKENPGRYYIADLGKAFLTHARTVGTSDAWSL